MLDTEDYMERIFYSMLKSYIDEREEGDVVICASCLEKDDTLRKLSLGYGDVKDSEHKIWDKISFDGNCNACKSSKNVIYYPLYTIMKSFTSMFLYASYKEFENKLTVFKQDEVSDYLIEYRELLDEAGIQDVVEIEYVGYSLPIVRFKSKKENNWKYQFFGISQSVLCRCMERGFVCRNSNIQEVISSVISAFTACHCIDDHSEKRFEYFSKKIEAIDPFVINNEQHAKIEVKAIYDKLMYQTAADEIDFSLFVESSSLEFTEQSLCDAYEKGFELEKKYADTLFEYLQKGKRKNDLMDRYGHIVTDNWKLNADISFDEVSRKRFTDLEDQESTPMQIKWLSKALKNRILLDSKK